MSVDDDTKVSDIDELIHVLIVDDQKTMRSIIRQLLHTQHIDHVYEAKNGQEALEMLKDPDVAPDVILCDLYMDEMDGMEFVHHIRLQKNDTPVLMLTGEKSKFIHEVSTQAGATKVLTKPISAPDLVNEIHKAIGAY